MEIVGFQHAGVIIGDAPGPVNVEVSKCSVCGALVLALGSEERKHVEFHAAVRVVTR